MASYVGQKVNSLLSFDFNNLAAFLKNGLNSRNKKLKEKFSKAKIIANMCLQQVAFYDISY